MERSLFTVIERVMSSGQRDWQIFNSFDVSDIKIWKRVSQKNGFLDTTPQEIIDILVYYPVSSNFNSSYSKY